jgi:hypothetical protein
MVRFIVLRHTASSILVESNRLISAAIDISESYRKGRVSTVDHLVLTSSDQLVFIPKRFNRTTYLRGTQMYWAIPFSKDSMVIPMMKMQNLRAKCGWKTLGVIFTPWYNFSLASVSSLSLHKHLTWVVWWKTSTPSKEQGSQSTDPYHKLSTRLGSAISNGRDPKSCLDRDFNFMLGSLTLHAHSHLQSWKLGPGFDLLAEVCPWITHIQPTHLPIITSGFTVPPTNNQEACKLKTAVYLLFYICVCINWYSS